MKLVWAAIAILLFSVVGCSTGAMSVDELATIQAKKDKLAAEKKAKKKEKKPVWKCEVINGAGREWTAKGDSYEDAQDNAREACREVEWDFSHCIDLNCWQVKKPPKKQPPPRKPNEKLDAKPKEVTF